MSRPIMLVDAMNFFLRNYMASPQMDRNGIHIGGAIGFLKSLASLTKKFSPKKIVVVWETGGSSRRLKLFPDYKNRRKPKRTNRFYGDMVPDSEENESYQKQILVELLNYLPVFQVHMENCEADDIIAYLSKSYFADEEKMIISSDKDFYQLLDEKTKIYRPGKKVLYKAQDVIDEYNIDPKNFVIAKALSGDPSDNIPGIERVGFKTLAKKFDLLNEEVSLDQILTEAKNHVENDKKPLVMYQNIAGNEELARRNLELMKLDGKLLSIGQINDVNRLIKEFKPQYNKIKFWRTYLDLSLDGLDVEKLCDCFYFLTNLI